MKGKNKLVPRLLGITKDSVMRVDEKTKEVLQEWPLTTVKRWAASPKSFTLVGTARHWGDWCGPGWYWKAACGYHWSLKDSVERKGATVLGHSEHWGWAALGFSTHCFLSHFLLKSSWAHGRESGALQEDSQPCAPGDTSCVSWN